MSSYQVDYLLSITRIPKRFYAMVMGLEGREAVYHNPGASVQSYVVAKAINKEIMLVPPEMIEDVKECESFSTSKEVLAKINEALIKVATQLINYVTEQPPERRGSLFKDVAKLHELANMIKTSFDAFMSTQDTIAMHVDMSSMPGVMYKQSLFDMQDSVEDLSFKLERMTTPPGSTAA